VKVKIVTDSSAYLEEREIRELDIAVVPLIVNIAGQSYPETELSSADFFARLPALQERPTTSQPALTDIYELFHREAEKGNSVLAIFISASFSGTYSTALLARRMVLEKYPQACIEVLNSQATCMSFAVLAAAQAAQEGAAMEEVLRVAREKTEKSRFLFVPDSLEYLAKGGRVSEAKALLGTILRIRPVLALQQAKVSVKEKVRTMEKALAAMVELVREDTEVNGLVEIGVGHVNDAQQAELLAERIRSQLGVATVSLRNIGPVLGLHLGPGTLGIGYCTEK